MCCIAMRHLLTAVWLTCFNPIPVLFSVSNNMIARSGSVSGGDLVIDAPKCPECTSYLMPNCLFFDELYDSHSVWHLQSVFSLSTVLSYYRSWAVDQTSRCNCLHRHLVFCRHHRTCNTRCKESSQTYVQLQYSYWFQCTQTSDTYHWTVWGIVTSVGCCCESRKHRCISEDRSNSSWCWNEIVIIGPG